MSDSPVRVMVVDDQRTMRSIVRTLLREIGITNISEAASGREALTELRAQPGREPDVVICDLHMEDMDGLQFSNLLRREKDERRRQIPVIILTGDRDELLHEVAAQVGVAEVFTKPVTAQQLKAGIESTVGFSTDG